MNDHSKQQHQGVSFDGSSRFYVPALDGLAVPISMFFPLVLVAMVPFRMFLLPKVFSKLDLSILTSVDEHSIAWLFY